MLVGREVECAQVDRVLVEARDGASAVLILRGEPGIGKSALCQYAIERAHGMTVLRARGVESESELAYAGLADLFRPILDCIDALPAPQAAALSGALALAPAVAADPFTVAAATLSLLAVAADDAPVLAVVDDAHWLDPPSAQALTFATRRLSGADGVGVLIAARADHPLPLDLPNAPQRAMAGLEFASSKELLAHSCAGPIADSVAERLHAATAGNPLALMEACRL